MKACMSTTLPPSWRDDGVKVRNRSEWVEKNRDERGDSQATWAPVMLPVSVVTGDGPGASWFPVWFLVAVCLRLAIDPS
jgi:hypothetical protein